MAFNDPKDTNKNEPEDRKFDREETRYTGGSYSLQDDNPILGDSLNTDDVKRFVDLAGKSIEANKSKLSSNGKMAWAVIGASSEETEYALDAALVIGRSTELGGITAVMTLIFTGGKTLPKQTIDGRRHTVKYTAVAVDQYDEEFKENLSRLIEHKAPEFYDKEIAHIGSLPIVEADLSDDRILRLGNEAINQVNAYLRQSISTDGLTIEALDLKNRDLIANISFHRGDLADKVTEAPHRADIAIDLDLVRRDNRDTGVRNALAVRRDISLAKIYGHVDLFYMGKAKKESRGLWRNRDDKPDTQIYGLDLAITKLEHNQTPSQMILALAQIPVLMDEQVLITGLRPGGQNQDMRTYKALGYEQDVELEEIPEQLSDEEWIDMCSSILRQEDGQKVTLQIAQSGISRPVHNLLVNACDYRLSETVRRRYVDQLIDAADAVTDRAFSESFGDSDEIYRIGTLKDMPVLLGTWRDEKGQIRDLRDIGYFEILTHYGARDIQMVENWDRCLNDDTLDVADRLEQMEIIIADYTGGQYRLTDRADSIELNVNGWLYTLTDACRKAGMTVLAEGITQDTSVYRRGTRAEFGASRYTGGAFKVRSRGGYGFGR